MLVGLIVVDKVAVAVDMLVAVKDEIGIVEVD